MLKHLQGIKWVGVLSLQDADILAQKAKQNESILEFGCGGSTLIFGQLCKNVISVDTNRKWIDITKKRAAILGIKSNITFLSLPQYDNLFNKLKYTMCFVDGEPYHRQSFAAKAWEFLPDAGELIFHDTRRRDLTAPLFNHTKQFFRSIETISFNTPASDNKKSNITVLKKCSIVSEHDWVKIEDKPTWTTGRDFENLDLFWEYK